MESTCPLFGTPPPRVRGTACPTLVGRTGTLNPGESRAGVARFPPQPRWGRARAWRRINLGAEAGGGCRWGSCRRGGRLRGRCRCLRRRCRSGAGTPKRRAASRNTSGSGLWRAVSSAATTAANQSVIPSAYDVRVTSRRTLPDATASGPSACRSRVARNVQHRLDGRTPSPAPARRSSAAPSRARPAGSRLSPASAINIAAIFAVGTPPSA